ncbi:MAG: hypothetical protein QX194_02105 [Methylococcales bacterium]
MNVNDNFRCVFSAMVRFLEPVKDKVGQKYIKTYRTVPTRECGSHILTFAPPKNKKGEFNDGWRADNTRWIARMQLHSDANPVLIYFPTDIIIEDTAFNFTSENCEFAILKSEEFESFCENTKKFLCMDKINERLDGSGGR